jgi:hypothetical protein
MDRPQPPKMVLPTAGSGGNGRVITISHDKDTGWLVDDDQILIAPEDVIGKVHLADQGTGAGSANGSVLFSRTFTIKKPASSMKKAEKTNMIR